MDKVEQARRKVENGIQQSAAAVIEANADRYREAHIEAEAASVALASASRLYRRLWDDEVRGIGKSVRSPREVKEPPRPPVDVPDGYYEVP